MTSHPATSTDDHGAVCKRPGCGQLLPAQERGRTRQFCSTDCARRFHNDSRIPAPAAGAGEPDPLTALDALIRQAASLNPASVRAQIADAEAARRRAEAAAVTAQAQAAEALQETAALTEALAAARGDLTTAQAAAQHASTAA